MAVMTKENENGMYAFPYEKPPDRTKWETVRMMVYDPLDGSVFGRTAKNWAQLLLFYTIFYAILAALFAICMQGLLATLNDKEPRWKMESSLIGTNPGLGFRPISNRTEEGSLIWYNTRNETTMNKWIELTNKFLEVYSASNEGTYVVPCRFDQPPQREQVCEVNPKDFGPCGPSDSYGYKSNSPCVFLKLNKIYDWIPDTYSDVNNFPDDMTEELNETISFTPESHRDQIWISCNGEHPADKEHVSTFEYYPTRGFPGYFYPYTNQKGYLSPLVAVRIKNPTPNVLINIECRAWAKNIQYRGGNLHREGSVQFELMVDSI